MSFLRIATLNDKPSIENLILRCFGTGRFVKAAGRLRENNCTKDSLCWVAVDGDDRVLASIQYWPVEIGGQFDALLLGPIVVEPSFRNQKLGQALIQHTLELARQEGHQRIILVGDAPYYEKVGFKRGHAQYLELEHPVNPDRLLGCALAEGAFHCVSGLVTIPRTQPCAVFYQEALPLQRAV